MSTIYYSYCYYHQLVYSLSYISDILLSQIFHSRNVLLILSIFFFQVVYAIPGYKWSGFKEIAGTATFIDKTMFINEVVKRGQISLLTAPQGFGKTTNLDMVRRFFEKKVDEYGQPEHVEMTMNYNLFTKNNLQITKNESFFKQYFAKYPVIYIDYSKIYGINSFSSFLLIFGNLQKDIFLQNKYLLRNPRLWDSAWEKNLFLEYMYNNHSVHTQSHDISVGFYFLSELLFKHFSKGVFVFIDEIDSFLKSLPPHLTAVNEEIVKFVSGINSLLLKGNKFVSRALIMGEASIVENNVKLHPSNIKKECVLYDDLFWKYFGITEKELEELLKNVVKSDDKKKELKIFLHKDAIKRKTLFERRELWTYYGLESPVVYNLYSFTTFLRLLQNTTTL